MTEKLLRYTLKEAKEKDQLGLLIWANRTVWDDSVFEVKPGNESHDFYFSQISTGEEATASAEWKGLSMTGFIAVSVQKQNSLSMFWMHVKRGIMKALLHSFR